MLYTFPWINFLIEFEFIAIVETFTNKEQSKKCINTNFSDLFIQQRSE